MHEVDNNGVHDNEHSTQKFAATVRPYGVAGQYKHRLIMVILTIAGEEFVRQSRCQHLCTRSLDAGQNNMRAYIKKLFKTHVNVAHNS